MAGWTVMQLKEELKKRGLSTNGRKAELLERFENAIQDEVPSQEPQMEEEEDNRPSIQKGEEEEENIQQPDRPEQPIENEEAAGEEEPMEPEETVDPPEETLYHIDGSKNEEEVVPEEEPQEVEEEAAPTELQQKEAPNELQEEEARVNMEESTIKQEQTNQGEVENSALAAPPATTEDQSNSNKRTLEDIAPESEEELAFKKARPDTNNPSTEEGAKAASDISKPNTEGVWAESVDPKTGVTYYYNETTRKSQWEKPEGYGTPAQIDFSKALTRDQAARVIGRQGAAIKNLQTQLGCRMYVDKTTNVMIFDGTPDRVEYAKTYISNYLNKNFDQPNMNLPSQPAPFKQNQPFRHNTSYKPSPYQQQQQQQAPGIDFSRPLTKDMAAIIIGRNGSTISALKHSTGSHIEIDKTTNMISFEGPPAAVSRAMSSINELVHNRLTLGSPPPQFGRGMGGRFPGRGPGGPPRGPGSESTRSSIPQWSSNFQQSSIAGANLSISGLPVGVKEEDVLQLFSRFGHVSSCAVAAEWGSGYLAYDSEAKVDIENTKVYGEGLAAPASVLENRQSSLEAAKKARQVLHGYQLDANSAIKLEVTQF